LRYAKRLVFLLPAAAVMAPAPAALADQSGTGGAATPGRPIVDSVTCAAAARWHCEPGQSMTVRGEDLRTVHSVTFVGRRGRSDDRNTRPRAASPHRLSIVVPAGASTGPLLIRSRYAPAARTRRAVRIATSRPSPMQPALGSGAILAGGEHRAVFRYRAAGTASGNAAIEAVRLDDGATVATWPVSPAPDGSGFIEWDGTVGGVPQPSGRYAFRVTGTATAEVSAETGSDVEFSLVDGIFPIRGPHDLGQSATNGFGGGRGHKGQDMFAACGTALVAAQAGRVVAAQYHSAAGYYVVIKRPDGVSHAYMHMRRSALVEEGEEVKAGQPLGEVGQTGRASGCHLHFELWTAPGWYAGGEAVDPAPTLRAWDALD
jgi:murein DD-endopeptidase MepM/ murein hydrolase activator NlpD